jgi:arsenate reductase
MAEVPTVLFVCVHNAGRSQMAAALLDRHAAGRVRVLSAGTEPADRINPAVVEAMAELGLDVSREFPKRLASEDVESSDVVVTMGCGDTCPISPAPATRTGRSTTQPAGRSRRCGSSAT